MSGKRFVIEYLQLRQPHRPYKTPQYLPASTAEQRQTASPKRAEWFRTAALAQAHVDAWLIYDNSPPVRVVPIPEAT